MALPPPPPPHVAESGLHAALRYTGVPPSVLKWRPRMPSKKMTVFLTLVGGGSYAYWYDRKECARLKEEYVSKVKYLSEQPLEGGSLGFGRKVTVYAAKWPEDDDYDRGLKYFKRYVKPILAAAAVDYDLVSSPQYGSLTRHLQAKIIKARRRALSRQLGLEDGPTALELPEVWFAAGTPGQLSPAQQAQREVEGGVIIVGRHTLKEYMEGLRRGWMCGVGKFDREAQVKALVEADGLFNLPPTDMQADVTLAPQPEQPAPATDVETAQQPQKPLGLGALPFLNKTAQRSPLSQQASSSTTPAVDPETLIPESAHLPPTHLPDQPPMLLLPWMNHLGFKQVPWMFIGLFNEREKYREGGEAAMKLIFGGLRDFQGSQGELELDLSASQSESGSTAAATTATDLDFDLYVEDFYKKSFADTPSKISKLRETYYSDLKTRLQTARDLASGAREKTKEEETKAPLTVDELKAERLKKEIRWRNEEEGYEIVKKGSKVAWDSRWKGWLKVYTAPEEQL